MNDEYDYIIDSFTKSDNDISLDVTSLNVKCITSKNDNFCLDSDGNLTVRSIKSENGVLSKESIVDLIYPVGSLYMSILNNDPTILFGGTWEKIKDKFILASGDNYEAGTIGGEENHLLTVDEMPGHTHDISEGGEHDHNQNFLEFRWPTNYNGTKLVGRPQSLEAQSTDEQATTSEGSHSHIISSAGGGLSHNNMPPYLAVYIWKRTS